MQQKRNLNKKFVIFGVDKSDGPSKLSLGDHHKYSSMKKSSGVQKGLRQILDSELRLGEMISRHIKKHGSAGFDNSKYIVTKTDYCAAVPRPKKVRNWPAPEK